MCHQSLKLSNMIDQNPKNILDKILEKHIHKSSQRLTFEPKGQGISKNQKTMTFEQKNRSPKKFKQGLPW